MNRLALSFVFLSSLLLGSCGGTSPSSSSASSEGSSSYYDIDTSTNLGTHQIKVKNLESSFSKASISYSILIPEGADEKVRFAGSEIRKFVFDASGVLLDIKEEGTDPINGPFVSLGKTQVLGATSKTTSFALKDNGFRLFSEKGNYFVDANTSKGVLNGAYGFLEQMIGFDAFAKDEYGFIKGEIGNKELDIVDVPDIDYRIGNNGKALEGDEKYRQRLRYDSTEDTFMMVKKSLWHNAFSYIDPTEYKDETDYFSESDGLTDYKQLCYSAHGRDEKKAKMVDLVASQIVEEAKVSPLHNVTFMQADVNSWCQCEHCQEEKKKYGTDSAVLIHFLNQLSTVLEEKLKEAKIERTIDICFFAYEKTELPPTVKNSDGSYSPIDDSVVLRDNVTVFYAPIFGNFNRDFLAKENETIGEAFKSWKAISKKIYAWTYQTNYSHYMYPYNSIPTMQSRYRFMAENSAEYLWDESQWDQDVPTGFHSLKNYLSAKFAWNSSLDYKTLLDAYFSHYFGAGSSEMRSYFEELCTHMTYLLDEKGMSGGIYANVESDVFFPKGLLDQWEKRFDKALNDIESEKASDPETFERHERRIKIESLFVRYALIGLYPGRYSKNELKTRQRSFVDDCYLYNVSKVSETVDIQTVFDEWDY